MEDQLKAAFHISVKESLKASQFAELFAPGGWVGYVDHKDFFMAMLSDPSFLLFKDLSESLLGPSNSCDKIRGIAFLFSTL